MSYRSLIIVVSVATAALLGCDRSNIGIEENSAKIGGVEGVLRSYKRDVGVYPTTQQGLEALRERPPDLVEPSKWRGPYAINIPLDAWQNPFIYRRLTKDQFELYSTGPDGKDGTSDDYGRRSLKN